MDRLHVYRDASNEITGVDVIDFKTDAVAAPQQLIDRYARQMQAYRKLMSQVFGGVPVRCLMLSTKLGMWIELEN
jgi:ATP-dependent exoDNAse (exonuclease V) beta subunit